jgi:drug/metabolite transporter (DMT)-like permease
MTFFTKNTQALAWGLIIILALIWGSSFILMKRGLEVFTAGQVGALRMAVAATVFFPITFTVWRKVPTTGWKFMAVSGIIGNLFPAFLFATAQTSLSSSLTGILNALTPLFTLLISIFFFNKNLLRNQVFGLLLGFIGTAGLSLLKSDGGVGEMNWYVWLVVLATLLYGISINVVKTYLGGVKSLYVSACALACTAPFSYAYLFSTDFVVRMQTHPQALTALGYLVILGTIGSAFALILFNKLVQISSAVQASMTTYLIPIVALVWGCLDQEPLTAYHFLGMLTIISGVYLVNQQGK